MVDQNLEDIGSVGLVVKRKVCRCVVLFDKSYPWRQNTNHPHVTSNDGKVVSKARKSSKKVSTRPKGGRLTGNRPFAGQKRGVFAVLVH